MRMLLLMLLLHLLACVPTVVDVDSTCPASDPECALDVDGMVGDANHDGVLGSSEISAMKLKMRDVFDVDDSGDVDAAEMRKILNCDRHDLSCVYQSLDTNQDDSISYDELDGRWETLGAELTVDEVAEWLTHAVQLPQYAPLFKKHSVSGYSFPLLIENKGALLQDIGVDSALHRRQIAMVMKKRFAGFGKIPDPVSSLTCASVPHLRHAQLYQLAWTVPNEDLPHRYQLQARVRGGDWKTRYVGPDTQFEDAVDSTEQISYRVSSWNSFARSKRVIVVCANYRSMVTEEVIEVPGGFSLWSYVQWLDEIGLVLLFIFMPYRLFVNGHANFFLRLLGRLPPNQPTRVIIERTTGLTPSIHITWMPPEDNGTRILSYVIRCTNVRNGSMQSVTITEPPHVVSNYGFDLPLESEIQIDDVVHGDTYKVVVEAFNASGLGTESSQATYMFPMPSPRPVQQPPGGSARVTRGRLRNKCYICKDPESKKLSVLAILDRKILHYCRVCDLQFCHAHKGSVDHSKTLSCPAIDGKCVCERCKKAN